MMQNLNESEPVAQPTMIPPHCSFTDIAISLQKMKKAKKVRIEVNIYQDGLNTFEFDVSKFDTNRYQ